MTSKSFPTLKYVSNSKGAKVEPMIKSRSRKRMRSKYKRRGVKGGSKTENNF